MVGLMLLIFDLSCCFSGAYGTSTFLLSGSGVDGCFPDVSLTASPPHPFMASRRHHLWCQTAVQRSIPLGGDLRIERSKIIKTSQNAPSCAVWAAGVLYSSCCNDGLPFMTKCVSPPYLSVAEGSDLIRSQTSVALRIPLCGDVWKERRQIILAGHHSLPSANRASRASASAEYAISP